MPKRNQRRYPHLWNEVVRQVAAAYEGCYVPNMECKINGYYRRLVRRIKKQSAEREVSVEKSPG